MRFATLVIVGLLAGACGSPARETPVPSPPERVIDATKAVSNMVEGRDYKVVGIHGPHDDGWVFVSHGTVERGVDYGRLYRTKPPGYQVEGPGDEPFDEADSVAMVELDDGRIPPVDSDKVTIIARHGTADDPRQIIDATRSGDQIVWMETRESNLYAMSWELYAADTDTLKVRHLASHSDLGIKNPPWPSKDATHPYVVDGWVYFLAATAAGKPDAPPPTAAYRVRLDGRGDLEKAIPSATAVYGDGHYVRYAKDGQLWRWDPQTRETSRAGIRAVGNPCGNFFHESVAVQCDGKRLVITEIGRGKTIIKLGSADVGYLNTTSRWVGFTKRPGGAYIYDLRRHKLMRQKGAFASPTLRNDGNRLAYLGAGWEPRTELGKSIVLLPE